MLPDDSGNQITTQDILASSEQLDEQSLAIYLEVPGTQVVLFQAYFETHEALGLVRTLDIRRSLICVMTTPSYLEDCLRLLMAIREEIRWYPAAPPSPELKERYLGYTTVKGKNNA